jgi:hypothetical protein
MENNKKARLGAIQPHTFAFITTTHPWLELLKINQTLVAKTNEFNGLQKSWQIPQKIYCFGFLINQIQLQLF